MNSIGPLGSFSIESLAMGTATIRAEWEGRLIDGKFPLLEWLGGSADCGVFLTVLQGIQRAAIKLIIAEGPEADAHLAQWASAEDISHRHIARTLASGRASIEGTEVVYVVSELAERVLSQFIQDRPLKLAEARDILEPTLDALDYLHQKGIVHGHIKPSNILIVGSELKVSGDGFLVADGVTSEVAHPVVYDAPETSTGNITAAADTWSIGMMLSEALMQRPPIWNRAGSLEPIVPDTLPDPFYEIVRNCLRNDPIDRWSLDEIRSRVMSVAPAEPVAAEPVRRDPEPPAYEPDPITAAADALLPREAEPVRHQPMGRARQAEPIAAPTLFSDFEEASSSRGPAIPLLIGSLLLLAFVVFLLVRADIIPPFWQNLRLPTASQKAAPPPPSQSATGESQPPASSPSQAPASSQPEAPAPSQPQAPVPSSQSTATTGQAQSESNQPSTQENQKAAGSAAQSGAGAANPASSAAQSSQSAAPENQPVPKQARHPAREEAGVPSDGEVASRVLPTVPESARESMHGPLMVTVRVTVNRSGAVEDASYVSPGPGNYFARIAVRAARGWKFAPPDPDGAHPQPSVWTLRFHFTRSKVDVTATEEGQ